MVFDWKLRLYWNRRTRSCTRLPTYAYRKRFIRYACEVLEDMIVSRYFWAGVFVAFLGLIVNYVFLSDVFVEIQTIPLMIVTIAGIRFHHFML